MKIVFLGIGYYFGDSYTIHGHYNILYTHYYWMDYFWYLLLLVCATIV
jgi:hypothetical protein